MAVWNSIALSDIRSGFRIDSEFYKSEYIAKDHELSRLKTYALGHLAKVTDGEHGSVVFIQGGVKYLTAEHIKQGYIDADNARFVSEEVDRRNARARVLAGDVLISIKGTLGEVGLAEASLLPANMNRDVAIIKPFPNSPSSEYITVFLRSRFGAYQLAREGSGGVQQMITLERLRNIRIPVISDESIDEVSRLYQTGLKKRQKSIDLYSQAQQLLESELGLDKLSFQKQIGYTAQLSELEISRRADADFFNPKLRYYRQELEKRHSLKQLTHFARVLKFSNPSYADDGIPIITQKHLGKIAPDDYGDDLVAQSAWVRNNPLAVLRRNDLLYYSVGAYLGKTNLWLSDHQAVHASFITMLRSNDEADAGFLQVFLSSSYGILQSKSFQSGTAQPYIYPKDIRHFLVPDVSGELKQEIHRLVIDSYEKSETSKMLLAQAKTRVEQLIEEAVKS